MPRRFHDVEHFLATWAARAASLYFPRSSIYAGANRVANDRIAPGDYTYIRSQKTNQSHEISDAQCDLFDWDIIVSSLARDQSAVIMAWAQRDRSVVDDGGDGLPEWLRERFSCNRKKKKVHDASDESEARRIAEFFGVHVGEFNRVKALATDALKRILVKKRMMLGRDG